MPNAIIEVRTATEQDLEAILQLEMQTAQAPHWSRRTYAEILASGRTQDENSNGLCRCLFVATGRPLDRDVFGSPRVVGFAVAALLVQGGAASDLPAELESVVVCKVSRRMGIGQALCSAAIAWASTLGATLMELEVRAGNGPAVELYRKLGFVETGRRLRYYMDPEEDAVVMRVGLESAAAPASAGGHV